MVGFFTKEQTASIQRPDGRRLSCNACGLYLDAHSPKVQPYGSFNKGIMVIGEALTSIDDVRGKPFQSEEGALLRETLQELGVDLFRDCISLNAVNCRPVGKTGKQRKPAQFEIDCCRRIVLNAIKLYKPKLIILLGTSAVSSVIGYRWKKELGAIGKWSGFTIPDQELKTWVCPVFAPSYVLKEDKVEITKVWEMNLRQAIALVDSIDFPLYKEPIIHYLKEEELDILRKLKITTIAFDYETTGLKPHAKGHRIVCMSVAVSEMEVYVFMMPKKRSLRQPVIEILEDVNIKKIGHNIKYEHAWTKICLFGTIVQNWFHDSLIAAHLLDNRTGVTGLKFQTYVKFGVVDYSSEISPVLQGEDQKDSNSHNKLVQYCKTPENAMKVMKYCALDSIFTYRLAMLQLREFEQLMLPF